MSRTPTAVGTPVESELRETEGKTPPSGPRGDNPATATPDTASGKSGTQENADGHLNPSPEDANATPGTMPNK